jgi:hypothetical protein
MLAFNQRRHKTNKSGAELGQDIPQYHHVTKQFTNTTRGKHAHRILAIGIHPNVPISLLGHYAASWNHSTAQHPDKTGC